MPSINESPRAVSAVVRSILSHEGAELTARQDSVAAEEPLEIQLSYEKRGSIRVTKNISVTMRMPGHRNVFRHANAAAFFVAELNFERFLGRDRVLPGCELRSFVAKNTSDNGADGTRAFVDRWHGEGRC